MIVLASPDKPNICYTVRNKESVESVIAPLVAKLRAARCGLPRVLIYCRRCEECAEIYHFFFSSLKEQFTEPVGHQIYLCFALFTCTLVSHASLFVIQSNCDLICKPHPTPCRYLYNGIWHGHRLCRCMSGHPLGTFI